MDKKELRIWAKKIRANLDMNTVSEGICKNIRALDIYKKAKNVMIFYPLSNEINLLPLLDDDKNFFLPKVNGDKIEVCQYKKGDKLILSDLKISEPITEPVNEDILDIVFTPALCADRNFHRLGYGGGFYDRFGVNIRTGVNRVKIICVIPEELIVEALPTESHDIKCDGIITQKKASFERC